MTSPSDPQSPPRHVLFVLDHFHPYVGGAETLFWELSRALVKMGSRVSVVTLRDPGTSAQETIEGIEVHRVATPRWAARLFFMILAVPAVWRRARGADLIHAAVYAAIWPAWLAATLLRKPLVLTVYEVFGKQWRELAGLEGAAAWALCWCERLLLRLPVSRDICISNFTGQRLVRLMGIPADRVSVVYPAVDYEFWDASRHRPRALRRELGCSDDTFVYLFFGRPGASKGVSYLIQAADKVRREFPKSRLVLLLAREPRAARNRILARIARLGLCDHVFVLNPVPRDELPGYLLAADCVVVPSISEGFGYSAVEACSLGCRVLATGEHAVEEILAGHVELCPGGDSDALANRLIEIGKRRPILPPAPKRFDLASHVRGTLEIYREVAPN